MLSDRLIWIIKKLKEIKIKNIKKDINQLELHKLLYIAYCVYMKENGEELFEENFHAWVYGPVIQKIYWNKNKNKEDPRDISYLDEYINKIGDVSPFEDAKKIDSLLINMEKIIKKDKSVFDLVDWTHEDACWKNTNYSNIISKSAIKEHHSNKDNKMAWDKIYLNGTKKIKH